MTGDDKNAHCDIPDSEKEPANGGKPMAWPRTRDDTQARQDALEVLEIVGAAVRAWTEMKKRDTAEYDRERLMHDELAAPLTELAAMWPEIRELIGYLRLHR